MRYIITERQYSVLLEQPESRFGPEQFMSPSERQAFHSGTPEQKGAALRSGAEKQREYIQSVDPHTLALILGIGSAFIPIIGPFVSAGIGLADAALYAKEGDSKTAGMVAMFSLLPGVGGIISKTIPGIKTLGVKGMSALASKLSLGQKITDPVELAVVNGITKNIDLVKTSLSQNVQSLAQQAAAKTVAPNVKNTLTNFAKSGLTFTAKNVVPYVGAGAGYEYAWNKFSQEPSLNLATIQTQQIGKNNQAAATQIQF